MDIEKITDMFGCSDIISISELKGGHINCTYLAECGNGDKYVLQSLNTEVFREPASVMSNIGIISKAFWDSGCADVSVPEYCNAPDGRNFAESDGQIYRLYKYTVPFESTDGQDYKTGKAFGTYIRILNEKNIRLETTVDKFHSFSSYFNTLIAADGSSAMKKIDNSVMRRFLTLPDLLSQVFTVDFPKRNVHNDAKRDNVILGEKSCIIDLDTTMQGYAALDYGDIIRSSCTAEKLDFRVIRNITRGFADGLDGLLSSDEIYSLYYGILYVTGELAVRYLIDYLRDDKYFKGKTSAECLKRANELLSQLNMFITQGDVITAIIYKEFKKN